MEKLVHVQEEQKGKETKKSGPSEVVRATVEESVAVITSPERSREFKYSPPVRPDENKTKAVKKIERAAARLVDLFTEQDIEDDMRVIREAKNATLRQYDPAAKKTVEVPDHKTRLAATQMSRAYTEGLPVARQLQITASLETADEIMERLRQSPLAMAALGEMQKAAEASAENGQKPE